MKIYEIVKAIQENWIGICLGALILIGSLCEPKKKEKESIHKPFKMK